MKKLLLLIVPFVLAVSCHRGPELIPRDEMEEIMREVLLQDQYLKVTSLPKRLMDTTLVYEGVFEKYGYNTDDYLHSLEYYLEDPSRMEKLMEKVEERLKKEAKVVEEEVKEQNWREDFLRIYNLRPEKFRLPQPRPSAVDTLYVQFNKDSLSYSPRKKKFKR
ncbi:MAG: DUF4296 domain-containing protein [Bacteroidales bacterium]|jgi:hypothetical protein|nr:DUF4296 domain-containing protein [Bacteroidales bacterium]